MTAVEGCSCGDRTRRRINHRKRMPCWTYIGRVRLDVDSDGQVIASSARIKVKWCHAYRGQVPNIGSLTVYLEGCTDDPEMLLFKGNVEFEVPMFGHDVKVTYVRSWDHDPTEAEKRAAGLDEAD